jgi:hypothetical protein
MQKGAGYVGIGGPLVGQLHLVDNLQVAHYLSIQANGHLKEMARGGLSFVVAVKIRRKAANVSAVLELP